MAAATTPIFTIVPNVGNAIIGATANTRSDGNGTIATDIMKLFTAGSNGSYIYRVRFNPIATAAATALSATVLRLFISNKASGATTSADTWLLAEIAAASQTADQTTVATFPLEIALNLQINASYTLLASSHIINAANTSWQALAFGGDY